jgi:peptidyl-prolyl cis-trans isomerase A (cyclophilin A)
MNLKIGFNNHFKITYIIFKKLFMTKYILYLTTAVLFYSCSQKKSEFPQITISTNYGDIEAELYPAKAPKTVAAFLSNIKNGFYKNSTFYRVLKDDEMPTDNNTGLIQGGTWPNAKAAPTIEHESTKLTGLSHTNGTLSMANSGAGTATTEFFICVGDQTNFDAGNINAKDSFGFAAFGKVLHGMDVVRNIQAAKSNGDHFVQPIKIAFIKLR